MRELYNRILLYFGLNPNIKLLSSFMTGSIYSFFLQISLSFLTLVSSIFIARYAGENELGVYTLVFTWISILYTIALFGLDDLSLRQIPLYVSKNENVNIISFTYWVNKLGMSISFIALILFVIIIIIFDYIGYIKYANFYLWGALSIPFFVLMMINQAILKGIGKISIGQISEKILQPLIFIASLLFLYLSTINLDARIVVILRVISFVFASFFSCYLIYKSLKWVKISNEKGFVNKSWYKSSFLFMSSTLLFILNTRIDIVFLGFYNIKPEEIAYYNVALKFSDLSMIPFLVICTVSTPIFSSLYHQNKKEDLENFYKKTTRLSLLIMFIVVLFFLFTGNWFLSLYGTKFESAYYILVILCLSKLVHVAIGPANYLLSMIGYEKAVVNALLFSVSISILLHIFLIPIYGILGASISTLVGLFFYDLFLLYIINKHTGILLYRFNNK